MSAAAADWLIYHHMCACANDLVDSMLARCIHLTTIDPLTRRCTLPWNMLSDFSLEKFFFNRFPSFVVGVGTIWWKTLNNHHQQDMPVRGNSPELFFSFRGGRPYSDTLISYWGSSAWYICLLQIENLLHYRRHACQLADTNILSHCSTYHQRVSAVKVFRYLYSFIGVIRGLHTDHWNWRRTWSCNLGDNFPGNTPDNCCVTIREIRVSGRGTSKVGQWAFSDDIARYRLVG